MPQASDCQRGDNSAVFHRDILDEDNVKVLTKPWIFDTDEEGIQQFDTEAEAWAAQRRYRVAHGFHPTTGLPR